MTKKAELDEELRGICRGEERTPATALAEAMLTIGISFVGMSYLFSLGGVDGFSSRTLSRVARGTTGIEWSSGQRIIRFCDLLRDHSRNGVLENGYALPYAERISGREVEQIIFQQQTDP